MSSDNFDTLDIQPTIPGEPGGQILSGRYKIIREIGSGGMGTVYLAEDTELDNMQVAVKVLPTILANNKRAIDNLRREAQTSLKLSHPNIVRLHTFESDEAIKYLVMEYVDGGSLEEKISAQGPMDLEETLKIFVQIGAGLDYAHSQDVLHRDIKPANIMLTKDGKAKLADFGIARQLKDSMTRITGKETSGTLLYMAPEQFRGGEPDHRSDIYSLTASIYECLSGHPPFWRGSIEYQILNEEPAQVEKLSKEQNSALLKALAKELTDRHSNAKELLVDLGADPATLSWQVKPVKKTLSYDRTIKIAMRAKKPKSKMKMLVSIGFLTLIAVVAILGVRQYVEQRRAHSDASQGKEIAVQDRQLAYENSIRQAQTAEKEGDLLAAVKFYQKAQGFTNVSLQPKIDSLQRRIAETEKRDKFAKLLAEAKSKDSKPRDKEALKVLQEALALYPDNAEALALKDKIKRYYELAVLVVPEDYPTIQQAIDAAKAGDTVKINPGTYREAIIFKNGVKLLGAYRDKCLLVLKPSAEAILKAVDCDDGAIENLTFDGSEVPPEKNYQPGVYLENSELTIRHCVMQNFPGDGIDVNEPRSAPTLVDNICRGNGWAGIGFYEGAGGLAEDNICEKNSFGIDVTYSEKFGTAPKLQGNICRANGFGIRLWSCNGVVVVDNKCDYNGNWENEYYDGEGIWVRKVKRFLIKDNSCCSNRGRGINLDNEVDGLVEGNKCERNGGLGIRLRRPGTTVRIISNHCVGNAGAGISLSEVETGSQIILENNICEENTADGVSIWSKWSKGTSRPTVTFRKNVCNRNSWNGISHIYPGESLIEGCTCERNGKDGIHISASGDASRDKLVIRGNRCHNNRGWGIYYWDRLRPPPKIAGDNIASENREGQIGRYGGEPKVNVQVR